jgi:hypothetical protein
MHTVSRNLVPKDVLHVPNASKNPIYVHKLPTNNNVFQNFVVAAYPIPCGSLWLESLLVAP